jgi:Tol biopolymer transport system component
VGGRPIPLATTEFAELAPAISPDGRWLAYTSDAEGQREVFVIPFPDPDGTRWRVTPGGGVSPVWSEATGELIYRGAGTGTGMEMIAIDVETSPTFSLGTRTVLFDSRQYLADGLHPMYALAPDGQRFLMVRREPRTPGELIVVENWFQELGGARRAR